MLYQNFFKTAVHEKGFRPLFREYTNPNARNIKFRGRHYNSLEELKAKKFENTIELTKNDLDAEIQKFLGNGTIRLVSREEHLSDDGCINPILFIWSNKPRVILHSKLNFMYTSPVFTMCDAHALAARLLEEQSLFKCDLESAFFQWVGSTSTLKNICFS